MRRVTAGLAALRALGIAALLLLLWNPSSSRGVPDSAPPLVLLDASLSMAATRTDPDRWRRALDSARSAARNGVVWRFGERVAAFDTAPPADGATRLGPALEVAGARGGAAVVVTDGAIADLGAIPGDLRQRPRVVLIERPALFDAFVADIEGPRFASAEDTMRLRVSYGTAGKRETGSGKRDATLRVAVGGRQVLSRVVTLPDSGVVSAELTLPASRFPPGWAAVEVRLDGVGDSEPRDDARLHLIEVRRQPQAVLLAAPPDWETRFLTTALRDVARVAVRVFVHAEPNRWRDGATLAPVAATDVARAVGGAQLVVLAGDPLRLAAYRPRGPLLMWPSAGRGVDGDWYVEPPPVSPLSGALAGIAWDSLPPATGVGDAPPARAGTPILTARLGRRGAPRALVLLSDSVGRRGVVVLGRGLWRWAFRGGAGAVAYRGLVSALVDWLLGEEAGSREQAVPEAREVPNGLPLVWRWTGAGAPRDLPITLASTGAPRVDTLRFDAAGRAELRVPPGVYRYALGGGGAGGGGGERALVAVEEYSDEWRPAAATLVAQPGAPAGRLVSVALRDRWWLFAVVVTAFIAEWAWRRRQGLP